MESPLLARARAGQEALEQASLHGVGSSAWKDAPAEIRLRAWREELAQPDFPVGVYSAHGPVSNWMGRVRDSVVEAPIVAGEEINGQEIHGLEALTLGNQMVLDEATSAHFAKVADMIPGIAVNSAKTGEAIGAFLIPNEKGGVLVSHAPLFVVTPRGKVPLRLDGPMQVAAGSTRLIEPRPGDGYSYRVHRSHPALVAIGAISGSTTSLATENAFTITQRAPGTGL